VDHGSIPVDDDDIVNCPVEAPAGLVSSRVNPNLERTVAIIVEGSGTELGFALWVSRFARRPV